MHENPVFLSQSLLNAIYNFITLINVNIYKKSEFCVNRWANRSSKLLFLSESRLIPESQLFDDPSWSQQESPLNCSDGICGFCTCPFDPIGDFFHYFFLTGELI